MTPRLGSVHWRRLRYTALPTVLVSAYLAFVYAVGAPEGWRDLGVPGQRLSFFDLRSVTSAWVCTRKGLAVLPTNPCDPEGRPANYPRIWLLPSHLGLGEAATVPLGIVIAVLFLTSAIAITPRDGPLWKALVYGAFLCTPAIMLGVERGNVDLLLFCLVALAAWLLPRASRGAASAALVLFAAVLKLFPIFALPLLLRVRGRRRILTVAAVAVGFVVYALITLGTIRTIMHVVPKSAGFSYGVDILGRPLARGIGIGGRFAWDVILVLLALAIAFAIRGTSLLPSRDAMAAPGFELDAFIAGVSIFLLTYVLFRNFDYRLCFVLLCLPLLLRLASRRELIAIGALVAMFGASTLANVTVLAIGVLAQYALFICLVVVLAAVVGTAL